MEYTKEEIARKAADILADPIFQFAMQSVEDRYLQNWRTSAFNDTAAREMCFIGVRGLEDIRSQLTSMAAAPKVEAFNKSLRAKHK